MNIKDLVYISLFLILFYMFINKTEKMSNTDIKKLIHEEYMIDVDAIRNLSKLANDLTVNKKLIVPGGLEIQGEVTMKKGLKIGSVNIKQNGEIHGRDIHSANSLNTKGNLSVSGTIHGPQFTKINKNISDNTKKISSNAGKISSNAGKISSNAGKISSNAGKISSNAGKISSNAGKISSNTGKILAETVKNNLQNVQIAMRQIR